MVASLVRGGVKESEARAAVAQAGNVKEKASLILGGGVIPKV